jgi:hypothetical protein
MRTPGVVARLSCIALAFAFIGHASFAQTGSNNAAPLSPSLLPTTTKLVAGVVTVVSGTGSGSTPGNATAVAAGTVLACPSGLTATDKYGDGCLANEVALVTPRFAVADKNSNIFISDWTNGLIRRIDAATNVITTVAGGSTTATCGAPASLDSLGDGCLSTQVKLKNPAGLAFSNGDLYFADNGYDVVRKIASTGGLVTTGGTITLIAGNVTTYGYNVNNTATSGSVIAATQGYLNFPFGIAFDAAGNLYIADEGNNALEVVNLNATQQTIQGLTVAPGTIAKIVGYGSLGAKTTNADCPDFTGTTTATRGGCYFGLFTDGNPGVSSLIHFPYGVAVDSTGNVYFSNEYYDDVARLTPGNTLNNYAGILNTALKPPTTTRGTAGSSGFATGSPFGTAVDAAGNLYFTDASNGLLWRVDAVTKAQYIVAGGATQAAATTCSGSTDTLGDGCVATQAYFGSSGTLFASGASPGIFGVSVDTYQNLLVGDTLTNVVRQVTTGAYFGTVGAAPVTQTLTVHFAVGDGPAATNPYVITAGQASFDLGSVGTCITNSDNTMDCPVSIISSPVTLGPFTGTLTVTSKNGATAAIALGGIFTQSPKTRLAVAFSSTQTTCAGSNTYPNTATITLTGTLTANGPNAPSGTITFFANGTQVGSPQAVTLLSSGAYGATLSNVFGLPNSYTITATYSGDTTAPIYFTGSTGTAAATLVTATPTFTATQINYSESTVKAGGTALYSFTLTPALYAGQVNLSCTGLPANSTCSFTPAVLTTALCSAGSTVALSIQTQGGVAAQSGLGLYGSGPLARLATLFGVVLALMIGLRRRKLPLQRLWMLSALLLASSGLLACSNSVKPLPATPTGSYTITVTATGSAGNSATSSFTVPLVVQ